MRLFPAILITVSLFAQEAPPIRVATTLVQVDAVVTDRKGQLVTNLTQNDFRLLEDGKPREITYFSFVRLGAPQALSLAPRATPRATSSAQLKPNTVNRTIALVVDDLQMSFESINHTRQALTRFVDQQMGPGDLVAIILTGGGTSSLQQFTTDKRLLHAAIERVSLNLKGRGEDSGTRAIGDAVDDDSHGLTGHLQQRRFAVGTFGTIRYVSEGMRDMPGRKSLVLFSDGLALHSRTAKPPPVTVEDARRVTDLANQSAVVIYSIDARGLDYPGLQAKDNVGDMTTEDLNDALNGRATKFRDNQQGLQFLAAETGGRALFDNNDLNSALGQMLIEQEGYYLIGFQPGEQDAARMTREGKYHRLVLKLDQPGMTLRYRKTYMGVSRAQAVQPTFPADRLLSALRSPFAGNGLALRLTPTFALAEKGQSAVQALLHIGGSDITFSATAPDGTRSAKLHIVAVTEGDSGVNGTTEKTYTFRVAAAAIPELQRQGFVYAFQHEVSKPGPYNLRLAVMDDESGRVGSASRFIEVPDVGKATLAISGISMCAGDWRVNASTPAEKMEQDVSRAVRVFQRGLPFSYGVTVYNARLDAKTKQPTVELQPRLIRGGQIVWEGTRFPVVIPAGGDSRRIPAASVLNIGDKTTPGEYLLELVAIERNGKRAVLSQWTDFELR